VYASNLRDFQCGQLHFDEAAPSVIFHYVEASVGVSVEGFTVLVNLAWA
jgi:hypothetical protein